MEQTIGVFGEEFLLWMCVLRHSPQRPPADHVHRQANFLLDELKASKLAQSISVQAADDGMFVIAAIFDEWAMSLPDLRPLWSNHPLQATRWMTNNAGVEVFTRLDRVRQGPKTVLATYVTVLGLGFLGRYGLPGVTREQLFLLRRELGLQLGVDADRDWKGGALQQSRPDQGPAPFVPKDPWHRSLWFGRGLAVFTLVAGFAVLAGVLVANLKMSSVFHYEIASVHAAIARAFPGNTQGIYAVPWYLVIGEPGSGRSTALHAMNLTWNNGDGPLQIGIPQQQCTYWLPQEAVFVEPEGTVLGPNRNPDLLKQFGEELRRSRPREHLDGILLVLNVAAFIDLDEAALEAYANNLRRYLAEVAEALYTDVPTYVVITRYDTLWGFAEVFQWGIERKNEEPWGFTLPLDTEPAKALPRLKEELIGLNARLEAFCLAKLSSDDAPEQRMRGFQHLAEVRTFMEKLTHVITTIAMANSFERAPWFRAVALGSAVPGNGDRLRAGMARFANMGLMQAQAIPGASQRPGGLPIHAFMKRVILPERDIVPLRVRWRDDKLVLACFVVGALLWVSGLITAVIFTAVGGSGAGAAGAPSGAASAAAPAKR